MLFPEKHTASLRLIEPSGSAFPATLAFQIRELERETNNDLKLDAILTVIDAENFAGYEDTSPTARMQASYTDMIIVVRRASPYHRNLSLTEIGAEQMGARLRARIRHLNRPPQHVKRYHSKDTLRRQERRRSCLDIRFGFEAVLGRRSTPC